MKKFLLAAVPCAAAVIVFLIYISLSNMGNRQQMSLWYVESDMPSSALEELAESYNSQRGRGSFALSLQSFSSEEELASAYEQSRPDLLLCSASRAASLGSRELLGSVSMADRDYLPAIEKALPFAGESFFPLGSVSPVLVFNSALFEQAGISPDFPAAESFLEAAASYRQKTGKPFFSSRSLLPLLCTWCGSLGYELEGRLELDSMDARFADMYNSLASAAIEGSFLPPDKSAPELVETGLLPCAFVPSNQASKLPEGLGCTLVPLPEDGKSVYVPEILGLAITGANSYSMSSVRDFVLWLESGFTADTALSLGFVPVCPQPETEVIPEGQAVLQELYLNYDAIIYPPLGSYGEKHQEMETALCRALDLLY